MGLEKRILIVDDDDAIRALVTTVFRKRGVAVDAARNGAEALQKLESCRYVLMVLDLMMPITSGYDVLEHLAQISPSSRPIVLVLTAGLEPRKFDTSLVVGTMAKPFDISLLVSTVTGCMEVCDAREQGEHCAGTTTKELSQGDDVN
jgi:DNA-binding response OmpR family regulator